MAYANSKSEEAPAASPLSETALRSRKHSHGSAARACHSCHEPVALLLTFTPRLPLRGTARTDIRNRIRTEARCRGEAKQQDQCRQKNSEPAAMIDRSAHAPPAVLERLHTVYVRDPDLLPCE